MCVPSPVGFRSGLSGCWGLACLCVLEGARVRNAAVRLPGCRFVPDCWVLCDPQLRVVLCLYLCCAELWLWFAVAGGFAWSCSVCGNRGVAVALCCCRLAVEGCELQVRVLSVPRFGLVDAGPFVASPMVAGFAAAGLWGHRLCVGARSWQFVIGSAMSAGCSSFPAAN